MPAFLIWQFYWREPPRVIGGVSVLFISLLQSYKMQNAKKQRRVLTINCARNIMIDIEYTCTQIKDAYTKTSITNSRNKFNEI